MTDRQERRIARIGFGVILLAVLGLGLNTGWRAYNHFTGETTLAAVSDALAAFVLGFTLALMAVMVYMQSKQTGLRM